MVETAERIYDSYASDLKTCLEFRKVYNKYNGIFIAPGNENVEQVILDVVKYISRNLIRLLENDRESYNQEPDFSKLILKERINNDFTGIKEIEEDDNPFRD